MVRIVAGTFVGLMVGVLMGKHVAVLQALADVVVCLNLASVTLPTHAEVHWALILAVGYV